MSEEVLTARITADVSEAIEGFRQVDREAKNLKVSVGDIARGFSGLVTSSYSLYRAYDMVAKVQSDAKATQQEITKAYLHAAALAIPSVISGIDSMLRIYTMLKASLGVATLAQWLYNKALIVTHALSGPAGWAILGVAAAVTAGAIAWMAMNEQQREYSETLSDTIGQTKQLVSIEEELSHISPLERLQREYVTVKRYYETFETERRETVAVVTPTSFARTPTSSSAAKTESPMAVSIGRIEVSAEDLGSPFDRDRAAEDLAKKIGHRLALKVITR